MSWIVAVSMATVDLGVVFLLWQLLYKLQKTSRSVAWAPWRFMRVRLMALLVLVAWTVAIHGSRYPWAVVVIFPLSIIMTVGLFGLMWFANHSPIDY